MLRDFSPQRNSKRVYSASAKAELMAAIVLVEEAVRHTKSPAESIPFLLRKLDCEMNMGNPGTAFDTGLRLDLLVSG